jgi:hypothetical protein
VKKPHPCMSIISTYAADHVAAASQGCHRKGTLDGTSNITNIGRGIEKN